MARFVHVTFTLRCTALTLLLSVLMATYRQMHHLWVLLTPVNETTPCVTFTTTNQVFFTCSSSRPFDPFVQRLDRRDSTAKLIENCVNSSYRPLRFFFFQEDNTIRFALRAKRGMRYETTFDKWWTFKFGKYKEIGSKNCPISNISLLVSQTCSCEVLLLREEWFPRLLAELIRAISIKFCWLNDMQGTLLGD